MVLSVVLAWAFWKVSLSKSLLMYNDLKSNTARLEQSELMLNKYAHRTNSNIKIDLKEVSESQLFIELSQSAERYGLKLDRFENIFQSEVEGLKNEVFNLEVEGDFKGVLKWCHFMDYQMDYGKVLSVEIYFSKKTKKYKTCVSWQNLRSKS